MSDVLAKICDDKRAHVAAAKVERPLAEVTAAAKDAGPTRGFARALSNAVDGGGYGLIAELKKASPSKGLIRDDFDPEALAQAYSNGGAACLSVLTDVPYFQGADDFLITARNACDLPVLRKDFMLEPYQIFESRALGADCILLIMAALDDDQAAELEHTAEECGMDALIEVHDRDELDRAQKLKSPLIGINNRKLKTLDVNLAVTETLAPHLPKDRVMVCESGLYTPDDLSRMARTGAHRFLVGESLMREADVEAATRTLLARPEAAAIG